MGYSLEDLRRDRLSKFIKISALNESTLKTQFFATGTNKWFLYALIIVFIVNVIWAINYFSSNLDSTREAIFMIVFSMLGIGICYFFMFIFNKEGALKIRYSGYVDEGKIKKDMEESSKKRYIKEKESILFGVEKTGSDKARMEGIFEERHKYLYPDDKLKIKIDFSADKEDFEGNSKEIKISRFALMG